MAFGCFKKLVEKITGKKSASQKKDGRPQQKQGGDAKGKSGNGRGRHGRRGRHGNGGEQQQNQGQEQQRKPQQQQPRKKDGGKGAQAQQQGKPEMTYMDISNYPAVIGLSPDGAKQIFRMGRYDKEGGMGVWISTVADTLRSAGFEPVISPKIQKVLDNPDDPRKWK
jgi:hypothetical protein